MRRQAVEWSIICASMVLLGVWFACAGVAYAVEFGSLGSGAGQFANIAGMAASASSGDLYIVDKPNNRVTEFTAGGAFVRAWGWGVAESSPQQQLEVCTSQCFAGLAGPGAGEFSEPEGIAVDNAVGGSYGDVYVADGANGRVEKFNSEGGFLLAFGEEVNISKVAERQAQEAAKETVTVTAQEEDVCTGQAGEECGAGTPGATGGPAMELGAASITVGSTGLVYVGDSSRVAVFGEDGEYLRSEALANEAAEPVGQINAIAVSFSGDLYVIAETEAVAQYEEQAGGSFTFLRTLTGGHAAQALAYDAADGTVFVENEGVGHHDFYEYNAVGARTEVFPAGSDVYQSKGIAWDEGDGSHELYRAGGETGTTITSVAPPSPGPLVLSVSAQVAPRGAVSFEALVDPEAAESTVKFEYAPESGAYAATPVQTIPEEAGGEPNFSEEPVKATVAGLVAGERYSYRLVAKNNNGTTTSSTGAFTMLPAAGIQNESASAVTAESATLEAEINPFEAPTEYTFEYRQRDAGQYTRVEPTGKVGAADEFMHVDAHVVGLKPRTSYEFRLAATNAFVPQGQSAVYGPQAQFVTQPAGTPLALPDGRGWELVSPVHKQAAGFEVPNLRGGVVQAAANGDGITYLATASTEANPTGEPGPEWVQVLSQHASGGGWSSHDIASPHEQEWKFTEGKLAEFAAFSPDLSIGLVTPRGETLLGGASERTPYLRRQAACEGLEPGVECYLPLLDTQDVTSGEKWGGSPSVSTVDIAFGGATPDLSHVALLSGVPLTAGAEGAGIYEWSAGRLQLVSLLPGTPEKTTACPIVGGQGRQVLRNTVVAGGDRVIFGSCVGEGGHLYMREFAGDRTVELDVAEGGAPGVSPAVFQDASETGSAVFFTDEARLTNDARTAAQEPDLYVYEASGDSAASPGAVTDLTVPVNSGESADVLGTIPGTSTDGSTVYLVAKGVLTHAANEHGEEATSGQPNLYEVQRVSEGGQTRWVATFIATLSEEDSQDWSALDTMPVGVSEDGGWLAFMSSRSLTGYDNQDLVSGQRDEEVFLYDAAAHRLVCASCDPSGARPRGLEWSNTGEFPTPPLIDAEKVWAGRWIASVIPAADPEELGVGVYPPRYLSDSGRLFFDSVDSLVPQDANGVSDVYEYEPEGVGSCASDAVSYSYGENGCVGLISSGSSPEESVFLDASENGDDVFFLTSAKLTSQETGDSYNVYDAHVCGVGWECQQSSGSPPPCRTAAQCKAGTQPLAGGLSPASSTFEGPGNLVSKTKTATKPSKKAKKARSTKCRAKAGRIKKAGKRRRALARCAAASRRSRAHRAARRGRARKSSGRGLGKATSGQEAGR